MSSSSGQTAFWIYEQIRIVLKNDPMQEPWTARQVHRFNCALEPLVHGRTAGGLLRNLSFHTNTLCITHAVLRSLHGFLGLDLVWRCTDYARFEAFPVSNTPWFLNFSPHGRLATECIGHIKRVELETTAVGAGASGFAVY